MRPFCMTILHFCFQLIFDCNFLSHPLPITRCMWWKVEKNRSYSADYPTLLLDTFYRNYTLLFILLTSHKIPLLTKSLCLWPCNSSKYHHFLITIDSHITYPWNNQFIFYTKQTRIIIYSSVLWMCGHQNKKHSILHNCRFSNMPFVYILTSIVLGQGLQYIYFCLCMVCLVRKNKMLRSHDVFDIDRFLLNTSHSYRSMFLLSEPSAL